MTRGVHVLVVEDDPLIRDVVRRTLERGDISVAEADAAAPALARLADASASFDAVVLDGLLPDMHGVELAGRLLESPDTAGLPICFVSGAVSARTPAEAGYSLLPKPLRPQTLVDEVRRLAQWAHAGGSAPQERRDVLQRLQDLFLILR